MIDVGIFLLALILLSFFTAISWEYIYLYFFLSLTRVKKSHTICRCKSKGKSTNWRSFHRRDSRTAFESIKQMLNVECRAQMYDVEKKKNERELTDLNILVAFTLIPSHNSRSFELSSVLQQTTRLYTGDCILCIVEYCTIKVPPQRLFARTYITTSRTNRALVYFFCSAPQQGVP